MEVLRSSFGRLLNTSSVHGEGSRSDYSFSALGAVV